MSPFYKMKHTWADKAAFLGLLAAGVLIAHLISIGRSAINFSEPVKLEHLGVQATVPVGGGWQSDKQWVYEENSFVLSSFFSSGQANPTAAVHLRYLLAAVEAKAEAQIEEKAMAVKGIISAQGSLVAGAVSIKWIRMKVPANEGRTGFEMFFGSGQSGDGRALNIEVRWSSADESKMAEEVFKRTVAGLEFKGSPLLDRGAKVVGQMKARGLSRFPGGQNKQSYFVLKDTRGGPAGYTIDILADLGSRAAMNIQVASSFYIRGRQGREQVIIFQGKDDLSEYVYKSETAGRFGRSGIEGVSDRTGVLSVKAYGTFIFGRSFEEEGAEPFEEKFYRPGSAAIPDVLAELVYTELIASEYERIMIDVIKTEGTIVPVVISRTGGAKAKADKNEGYSLRLDFLDSVDSYLQVYLDKEQKIYKATLHRGTEYVLEQSSPEELARLFPEKANEILEREE